jgi:hypothetical protein
MMDLRDRLAGASHRLTTLMVALCFWVCGGFVCAQQRLIDVEPYDQITLDAGNGNAVLKTFPLELKDRVVPTNPDPSSRLRLRLQDRPGQQYDCAWQHIAKVELFEQMILQQAEKFTAQGDFNEAFEYYDFLQTNYPQMQTLQASVDKFLYRHASAELKADRADNAFNLLIELIEREASISNLDRAFESVAMRVISERVRQERFDAARSAIAVVREKFAGTPLPKVDQIRERMIAEAKSLQSVGSQKLAIGDFREARSASYKALAIWPELDGLRALAAEIDGRYPLAVVGVMQPATAASGKVIEDWPSRRISRLLVRQLVELTGFSPEGGVYRSPLGSMARDDSGMRWSLQIRPEIATDSGGMLSGYDIANQLLSLSEREQLRRNDAWCEVFRGVSVQQVFGVQMNLARPLLRPERLLEAAEANLVPWPGKSNESSIETPSFLRPYNAASLSEAESHFLANRNYFAFGPAQPKELVEKYFVDSDDALKALRRGEIDILDRLAPWDINALTDSPTIAVDRYLLPTVHVLVPNTEKPLPKSRTFRRAMLYGIDRQGILDQALLAGKEVQGSRVVSGPFPASSSAADPIGYGNDETISPAGYEPRLALALFAMADKETNPDVKPDPAEKKSAANEKKQKKEAPIVIAHPAEPISRLACTAMVEQLKRIGIIVELKEYSGGQDMLPADYDFQYVELAAWEPVVDARRVLGENGLTGGCSSYMSLALSKLDQAVTWKDIRRRMAEVHRIAANEVVVVPLWQTVNFYAYRRGTADLGKQVVELYQNVEQWKHVQPVATR